MVIPCSACGQQHYCFNTRICMRMQRKDIFVKSLTTLLAQAGVPNAAQEAASFVNDNPGMEDSLTPQEACEEWLVGATEAPEPDPARYGAS